MTRLAARLLLVCAGISLVFSAFPATSRAATPDDVLVMAKRIDDIISLDPAQVFEFTGAEVIANIYDRLVTFDVNDASRLEGGAAQSWKISPDGKTYRFTMRPDMRFASGNPVTADDAAWSLQRVIRLGLSPAFILAQFGLTAENVEKRIRAEDAMTLVIELERAYAPSFLLYCLTAGVGSVLDRELVLAHEKDGDLGHEWLKQASAGSGPFSLIRWRANQYVILEGDSGYWRGAPAMHRVILQHIAEPATQRLMLEKGDIDVARDLSPDQVGGLAGLSDMRILHAPKGTLMYLGLNQKNPILAHPKVRKAFKLLVDYRGIGDNILRGRGRVHQAIIPKGLFGALTETPYRFNPERARKLLREAGYESGFAVTMDASHGSIITEVAQALQSDFAAVGIEAEIIPGDEKQVLTKYRARNHDIFIGEWGVDYQDPHSNADAYASNPDNSDDARFRTLAWRNAWAIPRLSELTASAILMRDQDERAELYNEIQRRVLAVSPFVVMFQSVDLIVERSYVSGLVWGPSFDSNFYRGAVKRPHSREK
ncbi:MAG: ABC transporter substrate-binding protein [Alphaproteobacteria bacterium]|nr:ABC transporter substrate-binding protein [Alphaproteobacteria bacterium]